MIGGIGGRREGGGELEGGSLVHCSRELLTDVGGGGDEGCSGWLSGGWDVGGGFSFSRCVLVDECRGWRGVRQMGQSAVLGLSWSLDLRVCQSGSGREE